MKSRSSLRRKLTVMIGAGGIASALIATAGFSWMDVRQFRDTATGQVAALANIVADQTGPAIALGDRKAAAEILNSLLAERRVRDAALYDIRGGCFARVEIEMGECPPLPPEGLKREGNEIVLVRAVGAGGDRQGMLMLAVGIPSMAEILQQYAGGAALIVCLSLVVAAIMALVLQARVSKPILAIAEVAERISRTHHFQERVTVAGGDELGVLAQSFNSMLDEIARRDSRLEREIAERKRVNAELRTAMERAEEAARLKSEFLANMSHEIRTPMNGVIGMISLVLDRTRDVEDREQLQVAQNAAQALVVILNDILDLSKMEAGKLTLEAIACDLHSLARDCVRMFEYGVREKPLKLGLEIVPECPQWVLADPVRMRQVLVNLIGNAVKFTAEGSVTVRIEKVESGRLLLSVRDTGIGIPAGKLESIFEAFTQADGSHTRQFGGTGLGLTITRRLVELMGGRLWAESRQGRGSCFFVELALASATAQKAAEPVGQNPSSTRELPAGLKLLVAEDNPINQKVIGAMLRRQGWDVTIVVNGAEACRCFSQGTFDVVLMDVQMPEMDGMEAAARIRQTEAERGGARTPILALTAHASELQRQQCLAVGMDDVLTKPVNLPELLRKIAEHSHCKV